MKAKNLILPDHTIDLCICDWVLEHIKHPDVFFSEIQRVLKPSGYLCIRTSNRWSYVSLLTRIINEKHHGKLLSKAQPDRDEIDIFPKYFKCNSIQQLKNSLGKISHNNIVYGFEAEPAYLNFSQWAYLFGYYFHKFTPNYLRTTIMAFSEMSC